MHQILKLTSHSFKNEFVFGIWATLTIPITCIYDHNNFGKESVSHPYMITECISVGLVFERPIVHQSRCPCQVGGDEIKSEAILNSWNIKE